MIYSEVAGDYFYSDCYSQYVENTAGKLIPTTEDVKKKATLLPYITTLPAFLQKLPAVGAVRASSTG